MLLKKDISSGLGVLKITRTDFFKTKDKTFIELEFELEDGVKITTVLSNEGEFNSSFYGFLTERFLILRDSKNKFSDKLEAMQEVAELTNFIE